METPSDHADVLRRRGYPVEPTAHLTGAERDALVRYGYWLEALAGGAVAPTTPEQEQFARVARGEAEPRTLFETAWTANREAARTAPPIPEVDVARRLSRVESSRLALSALDDEYQARRADVLRQVQAEIDAIDTEFAPRLDTAREACEAAEREARPPCSPTGRRSRTDASGRCSREGASARTTKGLARHMESYPELGQFRRVGQPSVSFRVRPPGPSEPKKEDLSGGGTATSPKSEHGEVGTRCLKRRLLP